jgi:hypothetical protein
MPSYPSIYCCADGEFLKGGGGEAQAFRGQSLTAAPVCVPRISLAAVCGERGWGSLVQLVAASGECG